MLLLLLREMKWIADIPLTMTLYGGLGVLADGFTVHKL